MQYCSSDSKCKEVQLLVQHRRGMAVALKGTFFFSVSSVVPSSFSCYAARFGGYSLSSSMLANYFLIRIFGGSIEYMVYHPDRLLYGGRNRERVLGLFSVEARRRHSSKSDHVMWKEESGGRESARARLKQTWLPPTFIARRRHFHILENHESIRDKNEIFGRNSSLSWGIRFAGLVQHDIA